VRLNPDLPPSWTTFINKASKKTEPSYQSAAEMRADLQRLKRDTESDVHPRGQIQPGSVENPKSRLKNYIGSYRTSAEEPDPKKWWIRAVSALSPWLSSQFWLSGSPFPCRLSKSRIVQLTTMVEPNFLPTTSAPATDGRGCLRRIAVCFARVDASLYLRWRKRRRSSPFFGEPNADNPQRSSLLVPVYEGSAV